MKEYPKIETIFNRDMSGSKKLIEGSYRNEVVKYLRNNMWRFTEKIDGTNISVVWTGHKIEFHGRTERADIPKHLLAYLNHKFNNIETEELCEQMFGDKEVTMFGEGYGPKIQNGGLYRNDVSFAMFDIYCEGLWLKKDAMDDIARTFNIERVPVIGIGTLDEAVEYVKTKPRSTISISAPMEGLVVRPLVDILDRRGNRIIVKIKARDFE